MNRLTKRNMTLQKWKDSCTHYEHVLGFSYPQLYDKLAEYEDTNLTPEEIINLNDFEHSQCAKLLVENGELKKALELACNYLADNNASKIDWQNYFTQQTKENK